MGAGNQMWEEWIKSRRESALNCWAISLSPMEQLTNVYPSVFNIVFLKEMQIKDLITCTLSVVVTNMFLPCYKRTLTCSVHFKYFNFPLTLRKYFVTFSACNDVDRWPAPVPGKTLHLPIMGVVMKVTTYHLIYLPFKELYRKLTHGCCFYRPMT